MMATTRRVAVAVALVGATVAIISHQPSCGFVAPSTSLKGHIGSPLSLAQNGAVVAAPVAPFETRRASPIASLAAAAALLLAAAGRVRGSGVVKSRSKIVMNARNPFPTTPTGQMNKRRQRKGRSPFYGRRQIAVRVNRKTNKPIHYKMHVIPGDTVQVIKGKDAGKVTTVLKVYKKWNRILCLGVNFCIKHVRPQRDDQVGQRVQVEAPMHSSNVMHYSEKEGVVGNLGIRFEEIDGVMRKIRYNKATGERIEYKEPPAWVPVLERVGSAS